MKQILLCASLLVVGCASSTKEEILNVQLLNKQKELLEKQKNLEMTKQNLVAEMQRIEAARVTQQNEFKRAEEWVSRQILGEEERKKRLEEKRQHIEQMYTNLQCRLPAIAKLESKLKERALDPQSVNRFSCGLADRLNNDQEAYYKVTCTFFAKNRFGAFTDGEVSFFLGGSNSKKECHFMIP